MTDIALDWQIAGSTGWGLIGMQFACEFLKHGHTPVVFDVDLDSLPRLAVRQLLPVVRATLNRKGAAYAGDVILRALGNGAGGGNPGRRGKRDIALPVFEDPALSNEAIARLRGFSQVITASQWNHDVLESLNVTNTLVHQGVDPSVFHPGPKTGWLGDRFVIFSGGKLEYRKGQDLVIAAFREFHQSHPEAFLLTAWHNHWPHLLCDLDLNGHVTGIPDVVQGHLNIQKWLVQNGVPADSCFDVGPLPNSLMGNVIREADVALFPNRCEGGTNLVAMEAMACRVSTIFANNTGQRDLVNNGRPLDLLRPVKKPSRFFASTEGWGEASVDEILLALEEMYTGERYWNRLPMCWNWPNRVSHLLETLGV